MPGAGVYAVEYGQGWMLWRRIALPNAGGLGEQPAKLIDALAYVADYRNAMIARELSKQRGRRERRPRADRG